MQALTFFAVGMCRNSLGPCALECGPSTPVTTNCAAGNFSPSIAMNGMLPPSPINAAGAPKASCDAAASDAASHGASAGAFQPEEPTCPENDTFAPYGGSASNSA